MTNFNKIYNDSIQIAMDKLQKSEFAKDTYGCGSSFVTIKYKQNPKFYNWAKKNNLLSKDGYYGAILDTSNNLRLQANGYSIGTLAKEFYNQEFAKALNQQLEVGAFTHTLLS